MSALVNGIGLVFAALSVKPLLDSLIPPPPAEKMTNIKVLVGSSGQSGGAEPSIHLCKSSERNLSFTHSRPISQVAPGSKSILT